MLELKLWMDMIMINGVNQVNAIFIIDGPAIDYYWATAD